MDGQNRSSDPRVKSLCERLTKDCLCAESCASEAARALNLSISRFRHVFKQATGIPFARFVKELRLKHARSLLLDSHLSVKEVAARVNFRDTSHFVRDFEDAFGKSPARYREKSA